MKEVSTKTDVARQTEHESARWYLATNLAERAALFQEAPIALSSDESLAEKAQQRLQRWKGQLPFQRTEACFTRRLAASALTEKKLLDLLAQPAENLSMAFQTMPSWLVTLTSAFEHQDTSSLPLQQINDQNIQAVFQALKPLLGMGFARLSAGLADLQDHYTSLPFDPATIRLLLFPFIFDLLSSKLTKTLVLELNVARVQGRLQGETPEQRFAYFLQGLAQPETMLAFLKEYPVLARQMVETIERWIICELEFFQRLCADWDEIRARFAPSIDPGLLCEINEGAGDVHRGGRSVITLTWSSGLRVVYKPHSLALDIHFQELLSWFNEHGHQPAFRTLTLLDKQAYGWCEFVVANGCTSQAEVERFYQRMGSYLAVLYVLEATDFHAENLIAAGEDPVLVDLETLLHPRFGALRDADAGGYAMLNHSVIRPGFLPTGDRSGIDMSGLTGQTNAVQVATWQGQGTDELQMVRGEVELEAGKHRPVLQNQPINVQDYAQEIICGFTRAYRLFIEHREEFLQTVLPRFSGDEVRVLLRPTQQYLRLKTDGFHPDVLRDALERDRLFDRLWIGAEHILALAPVIAAEHADLWNEDIPRFTTSPTSHALLTSRGEIISGFFEKTSLAMAKQLLQQMDESDLEKQIWLIRASLANQALNTNTVRRGPLELSPTHSQATSEQLLSAATTIGNRLHMLALFQQDTVDWLDLHLAQGQEWSIRPLGLDLYTGLPGVALFLAHLGALNGEAIFTSTARRILQTLRERVGPPEQHEHWPCIGAFNGAGSLIYLFSHLGHLWQESALYSEAEAIVAYLPRLIDQDELLDVIGGAAGCLAALLSLHAVAPSEQTLNAALHCGEHLLKHRSTTPEGTGWITKNEQVPLTGLAHGNAGIALNLLRLWSVSNDERFRQAALESLAYERKLFSPEHHNWPDLRVPPGSSAAQNQQERSYMVAWCHGAPGIALARLASLAYVEDGKIQEEISEAVEALLLEGFGKNHSLCHGDLGNLEILLAVARHLPEVCSAEAFKPLQNALLESLTTSGQRSGIPGGTEVPGLMLGLAGSGYALLRQVAPERVPSVLLLASPLPGKYEI